MLPRWPVALLLGAFFFTGKGLRERLAPHTDVMGVKDTLPHWCDSTIVSDSLPPTKHKFTLRACGTSVSAADPATVQHAFAIMRRAFAVYGRLTEIPYRWKDYTMEFHPLGSLSAGGYGGATQGHGLVFYDMPLPNPATDGDRPAMTAKILVHELAHQWQYRSGDNTSWNGESGWLGEGFSDFMAGQLWADTGGKRAEEEFLFFYNSGWSDALSNDPAFEQSRFVDHEGWYAIPWPGAEIWSAALSSGDDRYYRGALVLWMLQQYLGDARFWSAMHTFLTSSGADSDASRAFQRAIQTATGEDLDWFFREWVYGTSYPHLTVTATYDASAQQVTLQVRQTAPVFQMPIQIRVGSGEGDVLVHATVNALSQSIVVPHVMTPPTYIVFDDGDVMAKTLEFAQPTTWLVTQLEREAWPWQTWWAIEQLRSRVTQDSIARVGLIAAAQHGRYALTRAQALLALTPMAPSTASVLLAGLRDSAVLVRRIAARSVPLGTAKAREVLETVAAHDPSDVIRAEALQRLILARATPEPTRRALFAQALLGSPGYLDIVPIIGIKAMAQMGCDTTTVATLQRALHHPGVAKLVQRATEQLILDDPTCLQTFAAQLPVPNMAGTTH